VYRQRHHHLHTEKPRRVRIQDAATDTPEVEEAVLADALSSAAELVVIDEANIGLDAAGHQGMAELLTATVARGAAVVGAVRQGDTMTGADSTVVVGDRTVRPCDAGQVDIEFRGPADHIDQLTRTAHVLGFRPTSGEP
jgi:energy-coupling factor transporter ATP-binding protein EcfA2